MKQQFKGVVWNRGTAEHSGEKIYKYSIVGLLVTDKPIPGLEEAPPIKNPEEEDRVNSQFVLDGMCNGLAEAIQPISKRNAKIRVGDATMVMTNLREI